MTLEKFKVKTTIEYEIEIDPSPSALSSMYAANTLKEALAKEVDYCMDDGGYFEGYLEGAKIINMVFEEIV